MHRSGGVSGNKLDKNTLALTVIRTAVIFTLVDNISKNIGIIFIVKIKIHKSGAGYFATLDISIGKIKSLQKRSGNLSRSHTQSFCPNKRGIDGVIAVFTVGGSFNIKCGQSNGAVKYAVSNGFSGGG